ncbi:sugar ABC transporter permease [Thermoanaerobacterium thermosaccharolyticum]|uniref:carbohydrate ABC transporter permease n=1 Tax=Thermoanaerobacterium thermosaccharolyticum TaxID=1517 RepID=UPI000C087027|nr:carbohydrate ABC transporter permease [Thermoanaerobacterium thermosaccharolyticum]PHO07029.1 sugar ABC transporter permease [Thermoanaerobacterium thermosaccharolyticum]
MDIQSLKLNKNRSRKLIKNKSDLIFDLILYVIMIFVIVVTIYPFLNVLAISFNDSLDTVKGQSFIIPRKFTLNNYKEIFQYGNLLHAFLISVLRTAVGTATGVVSSAMLAYVLSREDFVFRKFVTKILMITMYVDGGLIPTYLLIRNLHLINTFWVYIIPGLISPFNVIVIRSFIDGIPISLQESAKLDGANDFVIFYKIIMPLCVPVIATISLFIAVGQWNSWFDTFLYCGTNPSLSTLQYELVKILDNTTASAAQTASMLNRNSTAAVSMVSPLSIRMAITIVATVPILLVYPFIQKYFVSGLKIGAVKG